MNIDSNPKTPQEFGVRGIPTLILFKNGKKISEKIGVLPKSKISDKFPPRQNRQESSLVYSPICLSDII